MDISSFGETVMRCTGELLYVAQRKSNKRYEKEPGFPALRPDFNFAPRGKV
jgi:hypothetical protein